ncbi:extracellular solute-binding protein [Haloquadratum walsbyi]|jgi:putative spermidine/putrescine transport system substrate-binding protein|uniref:ABC-type transport system periplasmic substrate-binding protein n=2 Tax=Haloquadratum walsbyi TaxID=293091 RepID=Q18I06_HALWD|nr:extracellular solute-binding protein [Haloquadratum walsbyi]CAJ52372.1 ABC-type transport system periplasmic substrate-binding protein [Haloquadratum walsbyi DSM 16790]CCC40337.1 ABC-type transport system periplasmic substrate-binding protein [Haloquadratum walsbyi C23]
MNPTRRRLLSGLGTAAAVGLAGCSGGGDSGSTSSSASGSGSGSGDAESFEVGYGDYQTSVSASDFPDKLFVYAVQTGWSNWGALMQEFENNYQVALNDDQRSSGEALSHARQNAQDPNHSAMNGGYTFGVVARNDGLTQPYKPANYDKVPDTLKTDDGHVTATRRMTTTVTYRKDLYEEQGIEPPETWEDLKRPEIASNLQIQPPQAAVGLAGAISINNAYGGSLDDVQPVIDYYNDVKSKGAVFAGNVEQKFTKGEIQTFVEYDYTGLDLKYNSDSIAEDNVDVSLLSGPNGEKGAFNQPYGYAMLKGAPNPAACKLFMDYTLSLEGQRKFLDAFVRPIRAPELELPEEFPAQSRYEETQFQVDYGQLVENQESIIQEIGKGVGLTGY